MPSDISKDIDQHQQGNERPWEDSRLISSLYRINQALAAELDLNTLMQRVIDEATALIGARFSAFFSNVTSDRGQPSPLAALASAPRKAFASFPMPRNTPLFESTFRGEGLLRLDDVTLDRRYGQNPQDDGSPPGYQPVRSYLAVPVVSRTGEVVGGLFFGHPEPQIFTERDERLIVGIAAQVAVGLDNVQSRRRLQGLFDHAMEALLLADDRGRYIDVNPAACALTGYTRDELRRLTVWDLTPSLQQEGGQRLWQSFLTSGSHQGEYTLRHKDGRLVEVEYRAVANIVPGLHLSVLRDITERKRVEVRQRILAEAGAILAASLDYDTTLANLARLAVPALADWCSVDIVEADGSLRRLSVAHADPTKGEIARKLQLYAPDPASANPSSRVLRTGQAELASEISAAWLAATARDSEHLQLMQQLGYQSSMTVALVARARTLGVMTCAAAESGRRYTPDDLALAEELARRAALALDNARLYDAERRARAEAEAARQRLAFLADLSAILSASLDYPEILDRLARCIVPDLADWCVIDMQEEDEWVHRLALAHKDPEKEPLLQELKRQYPKLHADATHRLLQVLRTRQPWLRPELPEAQGRAEARDARHWEVLQALGFVSEMIVPLIARGRVLGTITFVLGPGDRRYGPDDLALAEDLARRCALTIDNTRLYQETHDATRAKEESLALLDTLLASAPVGFGFLDREFRYVRLNQALAEINGAPIAAHLGRTPHEMNPQLTPILDPLRRYALRSGRPVLNAEVSGETRAAPGQRRYWLVSYYPVRASTGALLGLGIVVTDITERQRAEETLRQTRDELERRVQERTADLVEVNAHLRREMAERQQAEAQLRLQQETLYQREKLAAMGSLLASVAHELNNPLSIVMMQADLLREESRHGPLMEHARAITQAAERCMRIVQHFLTLARQHPPERRAIDLNKVMEDAIELLAYALRADNIELELELAHNLPTLSADPYQLQQVVVNLVTNAHQALRDVPPPRRLRLSTRSDRERTFLRFDVADTGPGIPPALQARIFEPFFTTKPPGIGTGLGLSLCRGIVEGHGGTISMQSQPGQGTIFSVELPVEAGGTAVPDAPRDEALPSSPARTATILVIDDEPGIVSALAYVLSRSGHAVETAANGRLALAKLSERAFDLILCDLRMPELDGPGFYQELAQRYPQLLPRIIFLTGDTLSPEARAFLERAGVTRLHKPFRAAEVRRIVHQVLQAL